MIKMKNSFILFLAVSLISTAHTAELKPKYVSTTVPLSQKHEHIRKNPSPDYWALSPYYVPQEGSSACGIASMTMLMNAARIHQKLMASDALVTQKALVKKIKIEYSMGLTLDQLGEAIKKSISAFGLKGKVEVIHAEGTPAQNKIIRELLVKNEKSDRNFIIANFAQSVYTGDPEGVGHISPVAAFNALSSQVLIMDVDREYYEPYWVSFDTFIQGMYTQDKSVKLNRGLVFVEFQ
jgi:hypothetical protein